MSVSRISIPCLILSLVLLFPLLLSFLFPSFFDEQNARLNDCFFKLRYSLTGSAPISPYLAVYFLDDQLTAAADSTRLWNVVLSKVGNNQHNHAKTVLVYPGSNVSYEELKAQGSTGKLFLPCMILNHRAAGNPAAHNKIRDAAGFIPEVHYTGSHRRVDEDVLSFPGKEPDITKGTGIANLFPDADGVIRRLPLFFQSGEGYYYPSLFLAALCHYCDVKLHTIEIARRQVRLPNACFRMTVRDIMIPVDDKGQMLINFPGPRYASFDLLSAARLLDLDNVQVPRLSLKAEPDEAGIHHSSLKSEPDEVGTGKLLISSTGSLILTSDISTWNGKFSTGIYDTVYPDVMILASAFNTVFTGNFLKPAGFFEVFYLYVPVLILLNFFLIMSAKRPLFFFAIGLPIAAVLIPVLAICIQLFLFIFLHCLPGLLPLVIGFPFALFLLIIFGYLPLIKQQMSELVDEEEGEQGEDSLEENNARQQLQSRLEYSSGKATIRDVLKKLHITSSSQVKISLNLLKGLEYKEIAHNLKISLPAVTQRIRKIYKKCNVHRKQAFTNKIYKLIKDTNLPYPPV